MSDERASRGESGPERPAAKQRERGAMRVGCNLLWLVPGAVGGSETAVVSLLRAHATAGRLDADELDQRLGTALRARTRADPLPP